MWNAGDRGKGCSQTKDRGGPVAADDRHARRRSRQLVDPPGASGMARGRVRTSSSPSSSAARIRGAASPTSTAPASRSRTIPSAGSTPPPAWRTPSPSARSSAGPARPEIVDHAMDFLWTRHRDANRGGYFWSVDDNGPVDASKQGYGHAFVLLAAASAMTDRPSARRADARRRLRDARHPLLGARARRHRRGIRADWTPVPGYRGQNANMHLTEALMAAFEATGERLYLDRAESIADLVIRRSAGQRRLARARAYHRGLGGRPRLPGQRDVPPRRHHPRACAGMVAAAAPALVPRRQAARLAARRRRRRCSSRPWRSAGTRRTAASSTRSTGTTGRSGA